MPHVKFSYFSDLTIPGLSEEFMFLIHKLKEKFEFGKITDNKYYCFILILKN